jgi:hypothetical protein
MNFGATNILKTAKGKIAAGIALFLLGVVAVLAAPTDADRILCAIPLVVGSALVTRGVRQDREEKRRIRKQAEKSAQKPKKRKKK